MSRASVGGGAAPLPTSATLRALRLVRRDAAVRGGSGEGLPGRLSELSPARLLARAGRDRFPYSAPSWPESVSRPAPKGTLGVDYDTGWSRRYPVRLARAMVLDNVTRPLARALAAPVILGEENLVGAEAPVIFAANHASHVDAPLLLTCLPLRFRHRTVVAAAADYFFDRRWKADLWTFALAAIPIERSRVNRQSAELAAELIAEGWNLVIFPEGGRSPDGWGQEFRGGAAYLAARTGRPVVPVHLDGTRHILPKGGGGLRRSPTTITFGTPLLPDEGESARRFSARVEAAVATLADERGTDWWTARRKAAGGTTPALQGPEASAWRRAWALPGPLDASSDEENADSANWPSDGGARRAWPRIGRVKRGV